MGIRKELKHREEMDSNWVIAMGLLLFGATAACWILDDWLTRSCSNTDVSGNLTPRSRVRFQTSSGVFRMVLLLEAIYLAVAMLYFCVIKPSLDPIPTEERGSRADSLVWK